MITNFFNCNCCLIVFKIFFYKKEKASLLPLLYKICGLKSASQTVRWALMARIDFTLKTRLNEYNLCREKKQTRVC